MLVQKNCQFGLVCTSKVSKNVNFNIKKMINSSKNPKNRSKIDFKLSNFSQKKLQKCHKNDEFSPSVHSIKIKKCSFSLEN